MADAQDLNAYWKQRKDILYYQVVRVLASHIGAKANSIIDVGSAGCPYLDWFDFIPVRTSVDLTRPYRAEGIRSYTCDFIGWPEDRRYDLVTCLQVLEHVSDAHAFAQKLLSIGETIIVSVPYKWPAGKTPSHVQDPVDETKMSNWFGREPNFSYVCRELKAPVERLINVYEQFSGTWSALNRRDMMLMKQKDVTPTP